MDITQLILDDHHEQRRLFAILEQIDRSDTDTLAAVWDRLAVFLELHAAGRGGDLLPRAAAGRHAARRRAGVAEDETIDAIGDHNDIRDAVAAVAEHQVGSDGWYAAVTAANLANSDHMAEEEREGLTDFRRLASLQLRHELAVAFAAFEARHFAGVPPVDKDPQAYVREEEEQQGLRRRAIRATAAGSDAGAGPDGSLSIGSLRTLLTAPVMADVPFGQLLDRARALADRPGGPSSGSPGRPRPARPPSRGGCGRN